MDNYAEVLADAPYAFLYASNTGVFSLESTLDPIMDPMNGFPYGSDGYDDWDVKATSYACAGKLASN